MGRVPVIEDGLAVVCGVCRLPMWWQGKKPSIRACGCTPEAPAKKPFGGVTLKVRANTATVGRKGEKRTLKLLTGAGMLAARTAGSGATASRNAEKAFDTDVVVRLGDNRWKVESKLLDRVPGLHSLLKLMAGSDLLRVQSPGGPGWWLVGDDVMAELGGLASEAIENRKGEG
ncbi:MAG: hypothetical protein KA105_02655 [Caulobacter sp.]|nr:hypothetical protein [Caulobacter sp.]